MTSFEAKLETFAIMDDIHPHPTEVPKGDFAYWNDLCTLIGIDLLEETLINEEFNARTDAGSESSEDGDHQQ